MSDSKTKSKGSGGTVTAILGILVVFVIAVLVNKIVAMVPLRSDLTENKSFTLSEGTKSILSKLDTPVNIRYYITDDRDTMNPSEQARARRVENMLKEYVRFAPSKEIEIVNESGEYESQLFKMLAVKKLNPAPNTDAEDAARVDGMSAGMSAITGNELYFGLVVECVDSVERIPWIPANDEKLLEYQISQAISSAHSNDDTINVQVMTSLQVSGGFSGNMQAPPAPAWWFFEELQKNKKYNVGVIQPSVNSIPENTSCLIVVHPYDISDSAEFAIDQYLLEGGSVIVFVDPNFFYSRALAQGQPMMPGMPPQGGPPPSSNLDKLFSSWGVQFDDSRVLADMNFGSEIVQRGNFSPTFLTLGPSAVNSESNLTSELSNMNMIAPGAFEFAPPAGIKVESLIESSGLNQFVSVMDSDPSSPEGSIRIRQNFEPSGEVKSFVARLSGSFQTAFPNGDPAVADKDSEDAETEVDGEKEDNVGEHLKESSKDGTVVVFADVDFLFDALVVERGNIPGLGSFAQPRNQNITLVQNTTELLSGDADLASVRSRGADRRPFTKQIEWQRQVEDKFRDELQSFEEKAMETEQKISEILSRSQGDIKEALMGAEVQEELQKLQDQEISVRKRVREIEKDKAKEFKLKQAIFKFGNTFLMPIVIALFGISLWIIRKLRTAAR